jgi:hypothetical protein
MSDKSNTSLAKTKPTSFLARLFSWFDKRKKSEDLPSDPVLITNAMPIKDPMDWSLTKNSIEWYTTTYCKFCRHTTEHREKMSNICNSCGSHGDMCRFRSSRQIWNGRKWVLQRKYGNGPKDFEILEDYTAADFVSEWDRKGY